MKISLSVSAITVDEILILIETNFCNFSRFWVFGNFWFVSLIDWINIDNIRVESQPFHVKAWFFMMLDLLILQKEYENEYF
jgi:hypothetical protein